MSKFILKILAYTSGAAAFIGGVYIEQAYFASTAPSKFELACQHLKFKPMKISN